MNKICWLLTVSIFAALFLPVLGQEGMFLDGVSYACISRNMAEGLGSFSRPYYTASLYPVCFEQPPLALWMQAQFFKLFGDHFWVERLYMLCMAALTGLGIVLNGSLMAKAEPAFSSWLPAVFWLSAPIVFWSYQNNMLECSMSVFVLFSVYFSAKSVLDNRIDLLILSSMLCVGAVLCKGPVGFFALSAPLFCAWIFGQESIGKSLIRTLAFVGLVAVMLTAFLHFMPGMPEYLDYYLHKQLFPTLSGAREKQVENPFAFLADLVSQLIIPAAVILLLLFRQKPRSFHLPPAARYFFALGLAGTLPLAFTPKQSAHYLLPAIPFFALGFAAVTQAWFAGNKGFSKSHPAIEKLAWMVLAATLLVSVFCWNKYTRDAQKIRTVKAVCDVVGKESSIGIPTALSGDWLLIAYFGRIGKVSLDTKSAHEYLLLQKGTAGPDEFEEINLGTEDFSLWKLYYD